MTASCPRCGSPLPDLDALAGEAEELARVASLARAALNSMRLAMPDTLTAGVRTLGSRLPALAAGLACHAGACRP